jgi:feruloyl-CoA synthase
MTSAPELSLMRHCRETVPMIPPEAILEHLPDGSLLLRHKLPAAAYDRQIGDWLRRWASATPESVFLGEWSIEGHLSTLTYAQAKVACDRISQALLDRKLSAERPVMILSEKSTAHALLTLAALQVGIPVAPVSPTYSRRAEARDRLKACLKITTPGLVLVEDGYEFADAVSCIGPDAEILTVAGGVKGREATLFSDLLSPRATSAVEAAFAAVDPDAPAKILFTSGSSGVPKPVINTHRMMCSNTAAQRQLYPFLGTRPPVVVDWQPWHHCGGANFNFHAALLSGGSYYIDAGKPTTPEAFAPTLRALRTISPTIHFNVPQGYAMLVAHLERDKSLRQSFFKELDCLIYSAAPMPLEVWQSLENLAVGERGERVPMVSCYGMTELAPMHTALHWHEHRPGLIGLPIPGSEVRLVPCHGRYELLARGPNVTPGYFRAPDLTAKAFDDDGWYITGDRVRFADDTDPSRGLVFEGRLTEEFKLRTGTFVQVGAIRVDLISSSPLIEDALIVGEGESVVGALLLLNLEHAQILFQNPDLTLEDLVGMPEVRAELLAGLERYNARNQTSSRRIAVAMPILDVPSLEKGETTDKGYINQRHAVASRAHLVAELFDPSNSSALRPNA